MSRYFCLSKHLRHYQKLQCLLHKMHMGEAAFDTGISGMCLFEIHDTGWERETLCLMPSAMGAFARVTPLEGIQVDEISILGNKILHIPPWAT